MEATLLKDFYQIASRAALPIPNDSAELLKELELCSSDMLGNDEISARQLWPSPIVIPLMALAQHHRVQTRLLDWTYNRYVAAYFAASEALKRIARVKALIREVQAHLSGSSNPNFREYLVAQLEASQASITSEFLCVWGLTPPMIQAPVGVGLQGGGGYSAPQEPYYQTVKVPIAGNSNLRAQAGVFLLSQHAIRFNQVFPFAPFETIIEQIAAVPPPRLVQVTLPASEAGLLLWLLALEGIDGAALFPGYDGVKRALDDRQFWRRDHPPAP